jgi:hypothetical protein
MSDFVFLKRDEYPSKVRRILNSLQPVDTMYRWLSCIPYRGNYTILAIHEVTEEVGIWHCSCPATLASDLEMKLAGPDLRGTEWDGCTGASTKHK